MTDTIAPPRPDGPALDHLPRRRRYGREVRAVLAVLLVGAAITAAVLAVRHDRAVHVPPPVAVGYRYPQANGPVITTYAAGYTQQTGTVVPGRTLAWVVELQNGSTPITVLGVLGIAGPNADHAHMDAALERGDQDASTDFRPLPLVVPSGAVFDVRVNLARRCLSRRSLDYWTSVTLRVKVDGVTRVEDVPFHRHAMAIRGSAASEAAEKHLGSC